MTSDKTPPAPCDTTCNGVQTTCDAPVLGEAPTLFYYHCPLCNRDYTQEGVTVWWNPETHLDRASCLHCGETVEQRDALADIAALTARLRAAEERERAASVVLRPEVQAFAEAIQRLLDKNQGEKGDGWKNDTPHELLAALYRKTSRLWNVVDLALSSGNLSASVLVAAASVGAHTMFVADAMDALAASSQRAGDGGEIS